MHSSLRRAFRHSLFSVVFLSTIPVLLAQSNSGTVTGTVTDPSGAVVAGASVSIANPVSEYSRTVTTDKAGHYQFTSLPFNPYHLTVNATGFASLSQDVDVRSTVPVSLSTILKVGAASSTVTTSRTLAVTRPPARESLFGAERRFRGAHEQRFGSEWRRRS